MKRILLCCGTGVATSTVVNKKVEEELKKRGHAGDFTISQCKAAEVPSKSLNFDLCVTTVPLSFKCDCPIVVATGIIINRGTEEIYNNIEKALWSE
ncbi:MAG: PTS sugar transporter subunit IIB [Erysipelotrichaceae bacterium]|nr:PTS sugar transporter subunit IIB [Erysipelotrichaceae bacterium]